MEFPPPATIAAKPKLKNRKSLHRLGAAGQAFQPGDSLRQNLPFIIL
jgi:hypothetical protein